jgi:hypothetical protein
LLSIIESTVASDARLGQHRISDPSRRVICC